MATSDPVLSPRLSIEPFSHKFLTERYIGWLNDKQLTRYSQQRFREHTIDSCREHLASFTGTPHYFWAIVASDAELGHIGNINAYVDPHHSTADLGIIVGEERARGRGLATEAWLAVCDYLLRLKEIRKVTAGTLELNVPMLHIMKKTEMIEDGRRWRQQLCEGEEVDMIHSALFRADWIERNPEGPFAT